MDSLDRMDRRILELLLKDSRISNRALARELGLAESSMLERVRGLERSGVLLGAHAEVDLRSLGVNLQAVIMIRLQKNTRKVIESFRSAMLELREVRSVFLVSGEFDFIVHVAVRDSDHLRELELDQITCRAEVGSLETSLIFDHRVSHRLPIELSE